MHKHHIIPRHDWKRRFWNLKGFNASDNIVWLTLEQHIQAHELLFEINKYPEDQWASRFLSGRIGKEEIIRKICRQNQKKAIDYLKYHPEFRHVWSKEEKEIRKKLYQGENNPFFGKKHSIKSRKLISDAHIGVVLSTKTKQKMSKSQKKAWQNSHIRKLVGNGLRGHKLSLKTKQLISNAAKKRWKLWKNKKTFALEQ